ncbi:MAG TPA: hypothetical protein VHY08_09745 [Bacillota bacterium]|nr:hypothetical protein [Bacillota bacterium]
MRRQSMRYNIMAPVACAFEEVDIFGIARAIITWATQAHKTFN